MKRQLVYALAGVLLATSARAAESEMGTIVAADPARNTFTIQTNDGERILYRSDTATRMMRDGATVRMSDLAVGTQVEVTAPETGGTEPRMASRIEIVAAGHLNRRSDAGERMDPDMETDAERRDREDRESGMRSDRMARSDRLPRTAGFLPFLGMLGAAGVLTGLLLRSTRK
jgi:hypothetical protein